MKRERQICLAAAMACAIGCGGLELEPLGGYPEPEPVQVANTGQDNVLPAEPSSEDLQPPQGTENANPPAPPIQPAPAPVIPKTVEPAEVQPAEPVVPTPPEVTTPEPPGASPEPSEPGNDKVTLKLISDDPEQNLEVLNMALERWITVKGELPERLEQLVMEEFLPMLPMEPIGKRFTIDRDKRIVVLVAGQ